MLSIDWIVWDWNENIHSLTSKIIRQGEIFLLAIPLDGSLGGVLWRSTWRIVWEGGNRSGKVEEEDSSSFCWTDNANVYLHGEPQLAWTFENVVRRDRVSMLESGTSVDFPRQEFIQQEFVTFWQIHHFESDGIFVQIASPSVTFIHNTKRASRQPFPNREALASQSLLGSVAPLQMNQFNQCQLQFETQIGT